MSRALPNRLQEQLHRPRKRAPLRRAAQLPARQPREPEQVAGIGRQQADSALGREPRQALAGRDPNDLRLGAPLEEDPAPEPEAGGDRLEGQTPALPGADDPERRPD